MARVGRRRKDGNPLGLEPRVYPKNGQWQYRHRDGSWEKLGTDLVKANERARAFNDPSGFGTLGYWIREYIAAAKAGKLPAGRKVSPRTIEDYEVQAPFIEASPLAGMYPQDIVREHTVLGEYRDNRVNPTTGKGKTRANRELSLVSATFSWLIELAKVPGLAVNPVDLITRFKEKPKERYVEDTEYAPVHRRAILPVRMAMELAWATLQRPADILALPPSPVRVKAVAGQEKRVVSVRQGKTGRVVDIEVTPELERILGMLAPSPGEKVVRLALALVHGRAGRGYTEDGMGAMLRRYCVKEKVPTFGLMDVRAKGATDMYLRGVPLETIQALMGHASVQTTEIYIKRMLATISTVAPNALAVGNKSGK